MNPSLLQVPLLSISHEGIALCGTVSARDLDLPQEEDRLVFDRDVQLDLRVSRTGDDVIVRGRAATTARCTCDRCLDTYDQPVEVADICQVVEEVEDELIDLTGSVREDIVLALPSRFLCAQPCRGLCAGCGANLNREPCRCRQEPGTEDPWAALDALVTPAPDTDAPPDNTPGPPPDNAGTP